MTYICSNCGKESNGEVPFCPYCGGNITEAPPPAPKRRFSVDTVNRVLLLAIILVVVSAVGLLIWHLCRTTYETAVETYMDIFFTGEYDKIEELIPQEVWDTKGEQLNMTHEQLLDQFKSQDSLTAITTAFTQKYGDNATVSYKINEKVAYDDSRLEKLGQRLSADYGIAPDKVNAAYDLKAEFYVKDDDSHEHLFADLTVVNIDGKWYIPEPEFTAEVQS